MTRLTDALVLAARAHDGQTDLAEEDYIRHVWRVAEAVAEHGESAMVVALLHDVLEDVDNAKLDGLNLGTPHGHVELTPEEIKAIARLSREDDETYEQYIQQIKLGGGLAVVVKLADLEDHMRGEGPPKESLRQRYIKAIKELEAIDG